VEKDVKENSMQYHVYIGAYTGASNKGIQRCVFDDQRGTLTQPQLAAEIPNPSFLALHPNGSFLYAANELYGTGNDAGKVTGFALEPHTGRLQQTSQQPAGGRGPCHLALDGAGKSLMVANYGSGTVSSMSVGADGKLGTPGSVIQHVGKGKDPKRQERPHAHGIYPDSTGRYALVADLGLDRVLVYALDSTRGTLGAKPVCEGATPDGAGPRHLAWSLDGKLVYVINEMDATVTVFAWAAEGPTLRAVQTLSSLPTGYEGEKAAAEIVLHPNGRFLFVSNRGDHTIATLAVGPDGLLKLSGSASCGGKSPRHIALDPSGRWMLVSNQDSDNVVVLRVDAKSGKIEPAGAEISIPKAVCAILEPRP
jgi:6-phosphogluconolactonase